MEVTLKRTEKGRNEVLQKTHTLTQGERMILAVVDNGTSTKTMQRKLRGIAEHRFKLLLVDLKAKNLIEDSNTSFEASNDPIDSQIIEKFVRQDPLDPVSITSLNLQSSPVVRPSRTESATIKSIPESILMSEEERLAAESVDLFLPLERQTPKVGAVLDTMMASNLITENGAEQPQLSARQIKRAKRSRQVQIGYWLVFAGLMCIIVFLVLEQNR